MPQFAPVVKQTYTDEERAIIAGYLLRQRAGTLEALASAKVSVTLYEVDYSINQRRYYRDAESYSRFLLYWIGYETPKDQLYPG